MIDLGESVEGKSTLYDMGSKGETSADLASLLDTCTNTLTSAIHKQSGMQHAPTGGAIGGACEGVEVNPPQNQITCDSQHDDQRYVMNTMSAIQRPVYLHLR